MLDRFRIRRTRGRTVRRAALAAAAFTLGACSQNDDAITRRVETEISAAAPVDQVKVTTVRRVVTLEGVVEDNAERNRVELATRHVPGILGVDNRLVIKPPVTTTGDDEKR